MDQTTDKTPDNSSNDTDQIEHSDVSITNTPNDVTPPVSTKDSDLPDDGITTDQINELKTEAIEYAKIYAKTGTSTRKEPAPNLANDKGPYYWWEKQATYESNTWSISYWEYDDKTWQLQATKVELQSDGHSRMTAYSMREDNDHSFPGFQIYREQMDDRYHPAAIEEIVYLNRVLKGLVDSKE